MSKSIDRSIDFVYHGVHKEYQGGGEYYSVHGSLKDFTLDDALSAQEDSIFKINENYGRSLAAISSRREIIPTSGKYYAMLIIYDQHFTPIKYVKEEFVIGE